MFWQPLGALHDWKERDYEAAKRSVALLTPAEIVNRFGTPLKVSGGADGKLRVTYYRLGPAGEKTGYLAFEFTAGFVSYVESHMDPM